MAGIAIALAFGLARIAHAAPSPAGGPVVDWRPGSGGPQADALSAGQPSGARPGLDRIQFWPWPPVQGQTAVAWLLARDAVTATVRFSDKDYPVELTGGRGSVLLPIQPLAEPGNEPVEIILAGGVVWLTVPITGGAFPSYHIAQETGGGILNDAQKVAAETERTNAIFTVRGPDPWLPRARFRFPFDEEHPQSAAFGQRRTYGDNPAVSAHAGQDFSAAPGTPVYAPMGGKVVLAEPLFVRGNAVILDHGAGVYTGYWHLSELGVHAGDRVAKGQLLGKVGSTGLSTGAHLHWEMRVNGVAVNPLQWLAPASPLK